MALPPGIRRWTFTYNSRGSSGTRQNRLHLTSPGVLDGPAVGSSDWFLSQVQAAQAFWVDSMASGIHADTDLVEVATTYGELTISSPTNNPNGARIGTLAPPQMGWALRLEVPTAPRRRWGRVIFPDALESDFSSSGAAEPGLQTVASGVIADIGLFLSANTFTGTGGEVGIGRIVVLDAAQTAWGVVDASTLSPRPTWLRRRGR